MRVLKPFIDKETGQGYSVGDVYESDNSARLSSLAEKGFIQQPKQPKEQVKEDAPKRKTRTKNKS